MSFLKNLFGQIGGGVREAPVVRRMQSRTSAEWRSLGNAALAEGDVDRATDCYREAVATDSSDALAHLNLGFVLLEQGQLENAETQLVQSLALRRPTDDIAHDTHYLLARIHRQRGSREGAVAALDAALATRPEFVEAMSDRADVLLELGRASDALDDARRLAKLRPGSAANVLVARALHALGRHAEALEAVDAALMQDPQNSAALVGRGNVLLELGRAGQALSCFEDAIARFGPTADWLSNAAAALIGLGRFQEARERVDEALRLQPEHAAALVNKVHALRGLLPAASSPASLHLELAVAHRELRELPEALNSAEQALVFDPALASAHFERAKVLGQLERDEEALKACLQACESNPAADVLGVLAVLYARLRLADEALAVSVRAAEAYPDDLQARSRELFFSNFSEATRVDALIERHREYGELLEARVPPIYAGRWTGGRDPDRKLRVGFVSSDLCHHPVALFLIPLLANLDRRRFDAFCYATGLTTDDATARIRSLSTGWVDALALSDAQLAAKIHKDSIDVLVDLAGHTGTPRLAVFAERPAPVQMTWLGYLNTTGLSRIDYRLCDPRSDPVSTQRFNTELLLHVSQSQWCYRPFVELEAATTAPCAQNGFITFGSFNNARKISAAMCNRWALLLARCPGSRLLLADISSAPKRQAILDALGRHGVSTERLEIVPRTDLAGYHRLYDRVDISLDTYPYGGGTTTIDSLWMGVPVITARGELPVSRSASSILELLQLDHWVAPSIDNYVECAVQATQDVAAIQFLRKTLRARLRQSPLMDEAGFARDFEAAVHGAWHKFCVA